MKCELFLTDHKNSKIGGLVQINILNMWPKQNDNFLVIYAKPVLLSTEDLFICDPEILPKKPHAVFSHHSLVSLVFYKSQCITVRTEADIKWTGLFSCSCLVIVKLKEECDSQCSEKSVSKVTLIMSRPLIKDMLGLQHHDCHKSYSMITDLCPAECLEHPKTGRRYSSILRRNTGTTRKKMNFYWWPKHC